MCKRSESGTDREAEKFLYVKERVCQTTQTLHLPSSEAMGPKITVHPVTRTIIMVANPGSNYYVHFRALDTDNTEMKYDSIKFESSDPDTLLVNPGKNNVAYATAIKTGTANIIVTATYAKQEYTYVYEITVAEPAYLATLTADNTQITMSNAYAAGYKEYVNIDVPYYIV